MRSAVAIDLGTVNTLIGSAKDGIVVDEPSVVALNASTRRVVAVGTTAEALRAGPPEGIEVTRPLRDGVISDPEACALMLADFLRWVLPHHWRNRQRVLVSVPGRATDVERRALVESLHSIYPHLQVEMVDETVAAAVGGSGEGGAALVLDIGGGTTEIGIVAGGGKVRSRSIEHAGNEMDEVIIKEVRTAHGLVIGDMTAERLKKAAGLIGEGSPVDVTGLDATRWGWLRAEGVQPKLVAGALERPVGAIVATLKDLLGEAPADLADDLLRGGVKLSGGGALLKGIAERIETGTCCRAEVVPDPLYCVVRGLLGIAASDTQARAA